MNSIYKEKSIKHEKNPQKKEDEEEMEEEEEEENEQRRWNRMSLAWSS